MLKPSILNALRKATDVGIRLDPTTIELIPHKRVNVGGGAWKVQPQPARPPQDFLVEANASVLAGITGSTGGVTTTEGAQGHTWSYTLTGRYDCQMEINDQWKNGNTTYKVIAIQPLNGYEKVGVLTAIGSDPAYG